MYAYSFVGNAKCKVQNVASFKPQNNIYKGGTFILSIWQMIKLKLRAFTQIHPKLQSTIK